MSRLSIIIPALSSDDSLDETLISVLENRPDDCDIVLACDQDYDDPYALSDEVDFVIVDHSDCWTRAANEGLQHTLSQYVHVMLPGIKATPGWCDAAIQTLEAANDSTVAVIPRIESAGIAPDCCGVGFTPGGTLLQVTNRELSTGRVAIHGAFPGSGFYRQNALLRVGGWDEGLHPRLASLELMVRFYELGRTAVFNDLCRVVAVDMKQAMKIQEGSASHYMLARDIERLYLRCSRLGCGRSAAHLGTLLQGVANAIPNGAVFSEVAGRLVGRFGSQRKKNAAPEMNRKAA